MITEEEIKTIGDIVIGRIYPSKKYQIKIEGLARTLSVRIPPELPIISWSLPHLAGLTARSMALEMKVVKLENRLNSLIAKQENENGDKDS